MDDLLLERPATVQHHLLQEQPGEEPNWDSPLYSITVDGIAGSCDWEYDCRPIFELIGQELNLDRANAARMRCDLPPATDEELADWLRYGEMALLLHRRHH